MGRRRRTNKLREIWSATLAAHGHPDQASLVSRLATMRTACEVNRLGAFDVFHEGGTLAQALEYLDGLRTEAEALGQLYLRQGGRSTCEAAAARLVSWCRLASYLDFHMGRVLQDHGVELVA
jgi:hypothetical protein